MPNISLIFFLAFLILWPALGSAFFIFASEFALASCRPAALWSYATFSQNFLMSYHESFGSNWMGVTWSLAVEEQFYCILPFIIRYSAPRKLPWLFVGLIVAAPLLRAALSFAFPNGTFAAFAAYVWMPCRADSLLLGALCAWSVRQKRMIELLEKRTRKLYVVLVILLTGAAVLSIVMSYGWPNLGYTWLALLYTFVLLIAVTEKRGFLQKIAAYSLLRRLGVIAYDVYLLHQGVLGLAHGLILNQAPRIRDIQDLIVSMVALVLTLVLANVSWIHFEKPSWQRGMVSVIPL